MRKRILQLARGKFEYEKPLLSFSDEAIALTVIENTTYNGTFSITSTNHVPMRGVIYSTDPRMECLTPQFEGEEVKIRYAFHGKGLSEGEVIKGNFVIVCNRLEYSLSFCVNISKLYVDSSYGPIKSLYEFANLAKENWEEAYQLFYHKSFSNIIKPKEMKEEMTYRGIVMAKPSNQNMEEFLVGIRKKSKILFHIEKTEYAFLNITESEQEKLLIKKDGWGYLQIDITSDSSCIRLSKERITTEDFIGSTCEFEYYIDVQELHAGKNYATVQFTSVYQTITVRFEIYKGQKHEKNRDRFDVMECKVGIMELYQAYRLKKIVTGVWANETIEILNHLHALVPEEEMYLLMKAQVLIINRQRQEAEWILDEFKKNFVDRKDPLWGYYLYIMTLMEREPSYVDRMTREIEVIFHENPDSVLLFWVLSFLKEEYYNNNAQKLKAIEYWVMKGNTSPYLYLEAYYLIWQDPYLLTKLDTFEIRVLRWAIRYKALTKDIAAQIFEIVETKKSFDPVMYELLCVAYEVYPKPANIGMICSYLIKGQQYERKYHKWYAKGIELELRITNLYEAYLLSMEESEIVSVPRIIQMYFQYECALPYRKISVLYNNIIAQKEKNKEVYQSYRRAMGKFAMEQVEQGHIDDNLAVVYADMLELGLVNEEIAHALSRIIFTNKVILMDDAIVRVIVYQRQMKDPQIVPVKEKVAYIQLFSKEYVIIFEDAKGRRYAGSIPFTLQPLMAPALYLEKCMALAPEEMPYIVAYFDAKKNYLTFLQEDKKYFERILFAEELSDEYKAEIIPEIIRFYQTCEYDGVIKNYLEKTSFDHMPCMVRRFLMELLVENHLFEKAYDMLLVFGIDQLGIASKVALSSYMIGQYQGEEDDFLLSLIMQAFLTGKYNDAMLGYLCNYYDGPAEFMRDIWKISVNFELPTLELEERILVQMMYTEQMVPEADMIFENYYENGGREFVILPYLSIRAHEFFLHNAKISNSIFELIEARYLYHLELNDALKLALLKHYADSVQVTGEQYRIEDELLAEYTCRNMNFAFYKRLDHNLMLKYHFYDKVFLEYRTNPRKHVMLHYSRDEDGENFITEDMIDVYDGIFVKSFVMFFGEMIQYYISEELGTQVEVTESNRMTNNDVYGENDESRYNLLNQMLISSTLQDDQSLFHNMKQYAGFDAVTKQVFKIL